VVTAADGLRVLYVTNKNQGLWILKLDREGEGHED